jgi:predicted MPP superfamily phosphohydrolase
MNYVLIGDIHSQADKLYDALSFIKNNIKDSRIVFLGDIFDTKNNYSDSFSVYTLVRQAEQELNAITIQSNHQDKLIRYIRGNKVELNNGLDKTIEEFNQNNVQLVELYDWLIRQSFGIVFRDEFGIEFRCAHAYFSSEVQIQEYNEQYFVKAITRHHKHEFLYGLQDSKKNRVNWWELNNSENSFVRVSGHYKTVYTNLENKSLVLDSCCGDIKGKLSIYDVNSRAIHQF